MLLKKNVKTRACYPKNGNDLFANVVLMLLSSVLANKKPYVSDDESFFTNGKGIETCVVGLKISHSCSRFSINVAFWNTKVSEFKSLLIEKIIVCKDLKEKFPDSVMDAKH